MRKLFFILLCLFPIFLFAQGNEFEEGQLYLKFKDTETIKSSTYLNQILQNEMGYNATASLAFKTKDPLLERIFFIQFNADLDPESLIARLSKIKGVEYVEQVPKHQFFHTPNDLAASQYNLQKIQAENAWDLSKGSAKIVIAIVDDAVLLNHPDLSANIWTNTGEIPNNGIDDDGNGWIDDVNGWDAADYDNNPNPVSNASTSFHSHGTHCAGIVSARTNNNIGIASIGYNLSLMPVKIGGLSGSKIALRNAYSGVDYAIANKANVISMSWGRLGNPSRTEQLLFDVAYKRNIVCVAAAGNTYKQDAHWPSSYTHVISVASTDAQDKKSGFSTYHSTVDVSAPGTSIYSTVPGSMQYDYKSGTSMACPLVSGICGLMLSYNPNLTPDQVEACLKSSCDNIDAQNPSYIGLLGAGRVNAFKALQCLKPINAYFTADYTTICPGGKVNFKDLSSPAATSWQWSFPGGSPSFSTSKNPVVTYNTAGSYSVSLKAYNANGGDTLLETSFVTVATPTVLLSGNSTISAGGIAFLKFDFTGTPKYKVVFSDGTTKDSFISDNKTYFHPVKPSATSTYTILSFSDSLCNGTKSGVAKITLTEGASTKLLSCQKLNSVKKISSTQGGFKGTLSNNSKFGQYQCNIGDLDKDGVVDIAVSAAGNTYNGSIKGSIFILFMNADGTVKSHQEIGENKGGLNTTFPASTEYAFGNGIHSIGDFNKDGIPDIAVGCHQSNNLEGALWILFLNSNGTVKGYNTISNGLGGLPSNSIVGPAVFGLACDTLGDINNDGITDLMVGGYRDNQGITGGGAIWVLLMNANGTVKSHTKYSKSSSEFSSLHANNFLGGAIANIGDLNKDGTADVIVSISGNNDGGTNTGGYFILFLKPNGTILSTKKLSKSSGLSFLKSGDLFGYGIKSLKDWNQDGKTDVIIGSVGENKVGAFYMLSLNPNGDVAEYKKIGNNETLLNTSISTGDWFGSFPGLWIQNDTLKLFAGAPLQDDGGTNKGSLYILDFIDSCNTQRKSNIGCKKITQVSKISATQGNFKGTLSNDALFGQFACPIGDLDKDGVNDIAVAAPRNYYSGGEKGSVFILFMNADGTVKSHTEIGENKGGLNVSFPNFSPYGYWFGYGLHSIGDFDKDGNPDIAVGCNNTSKREGALWLLFLNSNGTVKSYQKIGKNTGGLSNTTISDYASFGSGFDTLGDINNDGVNDFAVGGYREDAGVNSGGAIWTLLMNANGTVKSYTKYSKASSEFSSLHASNFLGSSIANVGDLNKDGVTDIVVGASGDNDGGTSTGALFVVFLKTDGSILKVKHLSKTNGLTFLSSTTKSLGFECKNLNDINNDGIQDILVSAPYDSEGGTGRGVYYVLNFKPDGSVLSWSKTSNQHPLIKSSIDNDDNFGSSGGLWTTEPGLSYFIGALGDDDGGTNKGAVYIVNQIDSCKTQNENNIGCKKLTKFAKISNTQGNFKGTLSNNAYFGQYSCPIGDLDKDGVNDIAVSAQSNYYAGGEKGSVFILFMNADGTVKTHTEIGENRGGLNVTFPAFSQYGYWFGVGVHSIGDFDKDGNPDIAVGCNNTNVREGALWLLFLNSNGTVKSYQKIGKNTGGLNNTTISNYANFGVGFDTLGDINNDGVNDFVVGGYREDDGVKSGGAIWTLLMNANGTVKSYKKYSKASSEFSSLHATNFLGKGIANVGDLNNDGVTDIVVAASGDNDGGANTGALFVVFLKTDGSILKVKRLSKSNGLPFLTNSGGYFGYECKNLNDINNDGIRDIMVTAPMDSDGGIGRGAYYILNFKPDGSVLSWTKTSNQHPLIKPSIDNDDQFGKSGGLWTNDPKTSYFLGASGDDDGGTNRGAIYVMVYEDTCTSPCSPKTELVTRKLYSSKDKLHSRRIIFSNDGNVLALISKETSKYSNVYNSYEKTIIISKLTKKGEVIWSKELTSTSDIGSINVNSLLNMYQSSDNSIYISHSFQVGTGTRHDYYLIKLDNKGQKLWTKKITGTGADFATLVHEKQNGNILFGGTSSTYGSASSNEFLNEITPNGNVVWSKTYYMNTKKAGNYHMWSLLEKNNKLYTSGWITPGGSINGTVTIKKHNSDGTLEWSKYLPGAQNDYGRKLVNISEDKFLYVGQIKSKGAGQNDILVSLFDTSGNTLWTKAYGTTSDDEGFNAIYKEGFIYVFGKTTHFNNKKISSIMLKIDLAGNLKNSKVYDALNIMYENSVLMNNDEIIMLTTDENPTNNDVFFQTLNLCGESACGEEDVKLTTTNILNAFAPIDYLTESHSFSLVNTNVTAINYDLSDSIVCGQILIKPIPCTLKTQFKYDSTCFWDSISFQDLSVDTGKTIQYWKWEMGDGTTISGVANPKHLYKTMGTFRVKLTTGSIQGDNVCLDSSFQDILIKKEISLLSAQDKDTICKNDSVQFTVVPSCGKDPYSYSWTPVAGLSNPATANPKASPATNTWYYVTATDSAGLVARDSLFITVNQACCKSYALFATDYESYCLGDSVSITENSRTTGTAQYEWTINPAAQWAAHNGPTIPKLFFTTSGTKTIQLIVTDNCGKDTFIKSIYINELPILHAGKDSSMCLPDTVSIGEVNLSNMYYLWKDKSLVLDSNSGFTKAYLTTTTTLYLTGTDLYTGCSNVDSVTITGKAGISVNLGKDTSICSGDSILLGTSQGGKYKWSTGDTSQYINYKGPGTVTLTLTQGICNARDTIEIGSKPIPSFSLGKDTFLCDLKTLELKPDHFKSTYSYLWDNNSTDSTRTISDAGTYWLEINENGCKKTAAIAIEKLESPKDFHLPADTTLCDYEAYTLQAPKENGYSYLWQDGSTNDHFDVKEDGIYSVIVSNKCGDIKKDVFIEYEDCECLLIFPTAFTPNDREPNNIFLPYPCTVTMYELTIFNRWGEKLFTSNQVEKGWDGTFVGKPVQAGNYLYKVTYITKRRNIPMKIMDNGIFTLLR